MAFDGWLRGFWFEDINLLKKYFNLWDGIIKKSHELKTQTLYGNPWTVPDEWITSIIGSIFNKLYKVEIQDYRLVKHIYHPENDFFSLHHHYLYKHMYKLQTANSRKGFFNINEEALISFYTKQNGISEERIPEVIYDYKN
jgi:hypothetical protein